MHQEKYNLNWHTYSDHLKDMLHEMKKSNELTDVTLVCDDKRTFKAHKVVLSACSSVFKSIIENLSQNNSVIYLRGIQHQEMESILEFMYLGVATFYQERMNEFLNVAKNLEVKEISKDVEFKDENINADNENVPEDENNFEQISDEPVYIKNTDASFSNRQFLSNSSLHKTSDETFNCKQCPSHFNQLKHLKRHIESIHEGVKYECKQCDHLFTRKDILKTHIQSIHEGAKYACDQCDYQARWRADIQRHKRAKH